MKFKKLTIGIRTNFPMFRIENRSGEIIDELAKELRRLPEPHSKMTHLKRGVDGRVIQLHDEDNTHLFLAGINDITLTYDYQNANTPPDIQEMTKMFGILFEHTNKILEIESIRRIGIVAEHLSTKRNNPSDDLARTLLKLSPKGICSKFHLQYEQREPLTTRVGTPDFTKEGFWNSIETFYDNAIDADHPEPGYFRSLLDVQKYYGPPLQRFDAKELNEVRLKFESKQQEFLNKIESLGLIHGE